MKYSTFEKAALEARSGLREIDAEIERLQAKRKLLDTLAHQLIAALPALNDAVAVDDDHRATADAAAAEEHSNGHAEVQPDSVRNDGWTIHTPAAVTAGAPAAAQASFANGLAEAKPYSLRSDGWPSGSSAEQRGIRELL